MARIAFDSTAGNTGAGGWTPLPAGDYVVQFDTVTEAVSSNNNAQLKLAGHVVNGPFDGRKVTIWQSLLPQAAYRLEALLSAALPADAYEQVDTGQLDDRGEPVYTYSFDTDDLVGAQVLYDVTESSYTKPGADKATLKNEFNSPRPVSEQPAPKAAVKPAARPAAAPAVATRAAAPAQRQAAPAARTAAPAAAQPARRTVGR
jgi:hypothetical protein